MTEEPKKLTGPFDRISEANVRRYGNTHDSGGTVTFSECRFCGHLSWLSTGVEPRDDLIVIIEEKESHNCQVCSEVTRRNPEIANWVGHALNKLERDILAKLPKP